MRRFPFEFAPQKIAAGADWHQIASGRSRISITSEAPKSKPTEWLGTVATSEQFHEPFSSYVNIF
jgi:hypothetical protein